MSKFAHLKELDVIGGTTAEYVLNNVAINGVSPTLILAPATEANKPYFNALLRKSAKLAKSVSRGKMTAEMLEKSREEDRDFYPAHIFKNWTGMLDGETGKEIKFSGSEAKAFVKALPNWMFDDIRAFCGIPENFVEVMDIETQAKN